MEPQFHSMTALFDQLGLPSDELSVERFIASHRPLPEKLALHEASFWNKAQSALLKNEIEADADWAEVIDQLDTLLRAN